MRKVLVSILTPTFNHERFIGQCIESVLAQSYEHWEMLIVDDGSDDRTAEIVTQYADGRIRFLTQSHRGLHGLADTYNDALRLARGELIAILEGDDSWPVDKLQRMVPEFDPPEVVLAYGLARVVRTDGTPTAATMPSRGALRLLSSQERNNDPLGSAVRPMLLPIPGVFTYPCTLLLRRDALEALGGFQSVADHHAVDWATCLNLALTGRFAFIPEIMGFWRRHATSVNSSLRLEEFLREDYRYLRQFALQHRTKLGLSDATLDDMERSWHRYWTHLWRTRGRHLLLTRDWKSARTLFLKALLRTDIPQGKAISVLGIMGSMIHTDIEWLWRLRNMPTLTDEPPLSASTGSSRLS